MLLDELDVGPFRIYASAIDEPGGCATAFPVRRRQHAGPVALLDRQETLGLCPEKLAIATLQLLSRFATEPNERRPTFARPGQTSCRPNTMPARLQ